MMVHIGETDTEALGLDQILINVETPLFGRLAEFKVRFGLSDRSSQEGRGWHPDSIGAVGSVTMFHRVQYSLSQIAIPGNGAATEKLSVYRKLVRASILQVLQLWDTECAEECVPDAPLDTWGLPAKEDPTYTSTGLVLQLSKPQSGS